MGGCFFFSSRRRHTRCGRDWSSDVCSSDLLAGGLFDYLPDEHARYLIRHAWSLVDDGGALFFTNIARGNPYRPLIEYFGDWFLIERTEEDVMRLCEAAGIP